MRILILDRFDVTKEPHIDEPNFFHTGEGNKFSLADSMLHSSKLLRYADAVIYINFDKFNLRNFTYKVVYCYCDSENLNIHLSNIFERYAYLYDISLVTGKKLVPFDFKVYVGKELAKLDENYSLVGSWRHNIRYTIHQKINSILNYNLYFIIMETWEKFWMVVLGVTMGSLVIVFLTLSLSNKRTIRYELGNNHQIEKVIDNATDESVLDVTNMPPERIIKLIDSLNATLIKYPDTRK